MNGERFVAAKIPGMMFVEFARQAQDGDEGVLAQLTYDMFASAMTANEFDRFREFCRGPDGPDLGTLMEILQYVATFGASRPTEPPSPSRRGRRTTGATSKDASSSPVSTPNGSLSTVS